MAAESPSLSLPSHSARRGGAARSCGADPTTRPVPSANIGPMPNAASAMAIATNTGPVVLGTKTSSTRPTTLTASPPRMAVAGRTTFYTGRGAFSGSSSTVLDRVEGSRVLDVETGPTTPTSP